MELLFEIGCEDLPSRFVLPALTELETNFKKFAQEKRLTFQDVSVYGTPRRLTLAVRHLDPQQADLNEVRTGAPAAVAFKDGEPTKAAIGFARGLGIDLKDLYITTTEKGEYLAANIFHKGEETITLLPELLKRCIESFNFPKSMRWGANTKTFARPIRWIVALYGGQVVPLTLDGYGDITSGNITHGHRFSPKGANKGLEVSSIESYKQLLREYDVVLDPAERKAIIEALLKENCPENGRLYPDNTLLDEVVNLVEKPHAVLLTFDPSYLELPDEVLISSMRSHQRYFAITSTEDERLMNSCIIIYNTPVHDPTVVRDGNHRVLRARLDDAKFFWNQDLKHPLEWYNEKLTSVVWLKEIGNMGDRARRIAKLAHRIAQLLGMPETDQTDAMRAGTLSKADLVTSMVFEFTDLQGVMGREYAKKSGESDAVARAIEEQYMPRGVEDAIPASHAGSALALAEKLDALVGCFGVGLIPTYSADRYALRRAAIGVVRILSSEDEIFASAPPIDALLNAAFDIYAEEGVAFTIDRAETFDKLKEFILTRFESQLSTTFDTDLVNAVLAVSSGDNFRGTYRRAEALATIRHQPEFDALAAGYKRVDNLLRKNAAGGDEGGEILPIEEIIDDSEKALMQAYQSLTVDVDAATHKQDWLAACQALVKMKEPIDRYFEEVHVMCDDLELRRSRLTHLATIQRMFLKVADLAQINP